MIRRLLVTVAIIVAGWQFAAAETITRENNDMYVGEQFSQEFSMHSGQRISINAATSITGTVTITAGAADGLIEYRKQLKAPSRSEAASYADLIKVEMDSNSEGVVIYFRTPSRVPWAGTNNSGRLDVNISIPDDCLVRINSAYFDIKAVGPFTEMMIAEALSKVEVEGVHGETEIRVSNRPLTVRNISGKLFVSNKYEIIRLEDIDLGDEIGTVINDNGEIDIKSYTGGLDARTTYERIYAEGICLIGDRNRIKNVSSPIVLKMDSLVAGDMRITNQYGSVELDISGPVDARFTCKNAEEGKVVAEGLTMEPTLIYDNRLEFITGNETADVRITTRYDGDIIINGPNPDTANKGN